MTARTRDADAVRRMLALALVLDGHSRADAAQSCCMDRQTLRDWVYHFNEHSLAGLSDCKAPGPNVAADGRTGRSRGRVGA